MFDEYDDKRVEHAFDILTDRHHEHTPSEKYTAECYLRKQIQYSAKQTPLQIITEHTPAEREINYCPVCMRRLIMPNFIVGYCNCGQKIVGRNDDENC